MPVRILSYRVFFSCMLLTDQFCLCLGVPTCGGLFLFSERWASQPTDQTGILRRTQALQNMENMPLTNIL